MTQIARLCGASRFSALRDMAPRTPSRLLVLALLALVVPCLADSSTPSATTKAGKLRGKSMTSSKGRPIEAFEGIPYAKPPVGEYRFEPPVPADTWDGIRDAVQPGNRCLQRNVFSRSQQMEGNEDCLYLNVYTPAREKRTGLLPVIVYIHGGGFMVSCGHDHGPEHLLNRDVVLVTINYRLGPLGFLSTGDSVIPGNLGLKDQVFSLKWVRDNIEEFGGDPNLVTIAGHSAGAASVYFLTLSPSSKGLFHRAIMMSGSSLAPWAFSDVAKAKQTTSKLAALVGCPAEPSDELKRCLQAKPGEDIIGTDYALMSGVFPSLAPFKPTAEVPSEQAFLDRHPFEALANGQASDVPFMAGVVKHEGRIAAVRYLRDLDESQDLAALIFPTDHMPERVNEQAYSQLRKHYFGDGPIDDAARSKLVDFFSDSCFNVAILEGIKLQRIAAGAPVFMYELEHYSNRSFALALGGRESYGMSHGDDLHHLFPLSEAFPLKPSEEDQVFSEQLVDLFTTFAATGNPTVDGSWKQVQDAARPEYAHVTTDALEMRRDFAPERMQLWRQLPVNMALAAPRFQERDEL